MSENIERDIVGNLQAPKSIVIKGGRIIDPLTSRDEITDIYIVNDEIMTIDVGLSQQIPDVEIIDATGLIVVPGFIDLHVHFRDPGQLHKESISSGANAAAAGGFTTVVQMPNTEPPFDSPERIHEINERVKQESIRILTTGTITKGRHGVEAVDVRAMAEAGAVALTDDGDFVVDSELMKNVFELAKSVDLPISQHCEMPSLLLNGLVNQGDISARLGIAGRSNDSEIYAVEREIQLAMETNAHSHIQHVSAAGTIELIRNAKAQGVNVTAEVTPHHLNLTDYALLSGRGNLPYDTFAKCNPPLRTDFDVAACIEGLADGTIDAIATDHAPHAVKEKQTDIHNAPPGLIGLETAFSLGLKLVDNHLIDLPLLIKTFTQGPVQAWNLSDKVKVKGLGSLEVGGIADITIINLDSVWDVNQRSIHSLGMNTPYFDDTLKGRVVMTIAAGRKVYEADYGS